MCKVPIEFLKVRKRLNCQFYDCSVCCTEDCAVSFMIVLSVLYRRLDREFHDCILCCTEDWTLGFTTVICMLYRGLLSVL